MGNLPIAAMERIIRDAGAERVSKDAAELFSEYIENIALTKAEEAVSVAKHAGRKTVKEADIKFIKKG
ncbi:MAG: NFYB/HAP3 family transcription factor subunit [Candidatus Aenigmarchaeota archaeon]|nr:NFYB/HAP3 family transcription factor subunit [Candidatus Aenigmarchaeota archaeon]